MSAAPSLAVSAVSAGLALTLLSLLLYKLLRVLAALAVVLLPLRLFGAHLTWEPADRVRRT